MKNLIKNIAHYITRDKISYHCQKVLKVRSKLLKTNSKVKKNILLRKYNNLLFKTQSSIPVWGGVSNLINFPHGLSGIFISSSATIGDGCTIFQQVTIGSNTLVDSKNCGAPKIGKNCYIGAGAKIIGNVTIGDNVRIGANVCVTKDIPSNSTVVSAPIRIIEHKETLNNEFMSINEFNEYNKK